ncbi:MAG: hypothetical protein KZQ64_12225 [gamma proteobacterium symbiont of Bathyaustriella thionipta]|nr:hypothetical protein [gamma proteobacterium symbiont of Bathyaustriella thionipta]MCU7948439.1 hypothetical protein [gamma proteobacterium symbiont of Bathyaustriella thionipta]MCU7954138.1 hypothetical protein [gamma proteobacterium symbiont of Bathyaustriella thionipta]MCU7955989.1 hypothetical protein [gamma proteobacterium symbiont of Bathyaustriella thionipta]MCU7968160.1 hypothetical protein [gamma proteobacterium symbiont of Bathyaustriella thionipta]
MKKNRLPEHGVLIQVSHMGIYLTGDSGVGKSEIALQLIHQGARLICDDAPELTTNINTKKILGTCPEGFYGLMHIHDLGLINLLDIIGQQSFKSSQPIDFVIELVKANDKQAIITQQNPQHLLTPDYQKWHYQSCSVSGIRIHLYPDRNIPLIINTAIEQFIRFKDLINTKSGHQLKG